MAVMGESLSFGGVRGGDRWLGRAGGADAAPDRGEVDGVGAVYSPGLSAVQCGFDVLEPNVGPADGNGVPVVGSPNVDDDGDELAAVIETRASPGGARLRLNRSWRGTPSAGSMKSNAEPKSMSDIVIVLWVGQWWMQGRARGV
jgi:hypothetical protein